MRHGLYLLPLLLISACTWQSSHGEEINISAPILADQRWQITGFDKAVGECTVSAGELDVKQKKAGGKLTAEIGVSHKMHPGYSYRLFIGDQRFETTQQTFRSSMTGSIVDALKSNSIAYTEYVEKTPSRMSGYVRNANKLPTSGFYQAYYDCSQKLSAIK